jgi:RimJ/RimL family protein N-acetyltransferase
MSIDDSYLVATPPLDLIHTERMSCERLHPEHATELGRHLRDPRVARWLTTTGRPPTELEVIASLAAKVAHWDRHGFGLWLLRDRSSGEMIGRGGLQHTFVAGMQEIEVAWSIVPERWGQGLATELALASAGAGFDQLHLPQLVAFTMPDNLASRRVMEKAEFTYDREVEHVGLPHVLYRRYAARYRRNPRRQRSQNPPGPLLGSTSRFL